MLRRTRLTREEFRRYPGKEGEELLYRRALGLRSSRELAQPNRNL